MRASLENILERVQQGAKTITHSLSYVIITAASSAIILFSGNAAAQQAPSPTSIPTAPASTPEVDAGLSERLQEFSVICNNPTYMAWLTRNAVSCVGVDANTLRLQMKSPIGNADVQDREQWRGYKFSDLFSSLDLRVTPEVSSNIAAGIAELHNSKLFANASTTNRLYPEFFSVAVVGSPARGGTRLEVVYDVQGHTQKYGQPNFGKRVKTRYGVNAPIWNKYEILTLNSTLLKHIEVGTLQRKISGEESRREATLARYSTPGRLVMEQYDPNTDMVLAEVTPAPDGTILLPEGVYRTTVRNATDRATFIDVDGDEKDDAGQPIPFSSGFAGTIKVQSRYTGIKPLTPEMRRQLETPQVYAVNVTTAPASVPVAEPQPPTAPQPPQPPTAPASELPAVPGTDEPTPRAPEALKPESLSSYFENVFVQRLGPHIATAVAAGVYHLSFNQDFVQSGLEGRSNAIGPVVAGQLEGILGKLGNETNGLGFRLRGEHRSVDNGQGVIEHNGQQRGTFTYDGRAYDLDAQLAYVRGLVKRSGEEHNRANLLLGLMVEQDEYAVAGNNVGDNTRTTRKYLVVLGYEARLGFPDDYAGHLANIQLAVGANRQQNTNGITYEPGLTAGVAARYGYRTPQLGIDLDIQLEHLRMNNGAQKERVDRQELWIGGRMRSAVLFSGRQDHQAGIELLHRTGLLDQSTRSGQQLEEGLHETQARLFIDFAF